MGDTDDEGDDPTIDSDALDDDNDHHNLLNLNNEGVDLDDDDDNGPSLVSDYTDSLTELRFGDENSSDFSGDGCSSDEDLLNMLEWAEGELDGKDCYAYDYSY